MKILNLFIILIIPLIGNSQIFKSIDIELDTLKEYSRGNYNNNSKKQGFWEYFREETYIKRYDSYFVDTIIEVEKICEGIYDEGKRIGEWKFYLNKNEAPSFFYEGTISDAPLFTLFYHNDSSITCTKQYMGILREMNYNKDSTKISGTFTIGIFSKHPSRIQVSCIKNNITFPCVISNVSKTTINCNYDELEFYLTRLFWDDFYKPLNER